jgi:nucleoside-diphosphate-sugar epimerase
LAIPLNLEFTPSIYILGASGFLGAALTSVGRSLGIELSLHFSRVRKDDDVKTSTNIKVFRLEDFERVFVPKNLDAIIHAASINETLICNPEFNMNLELSKIQNLVSIAAKKEVKRFCYISTTQLYEPGNNLINENSPIKIDTRYKKFHFEIEQYLLSQAHLFEKGVKVFRVANVFTSEFERAHRRRNLVPTSLIYSAIENGVISLLTSGHQRRSFVSDESAASQIFESILLRRDINAVEIIASAFSPRIMDISNDIIALFHASGKHIDLKIANENVDAIKDYQFESLFAKLPDAISHETVFKQALSKLIKGFIRNL